jgi:hypothetical protein
MPACHIAINTSESGDSAPPAYSSPLVRSEPSDDKILASTTSIRYDDCLPEVVTPEMSQGVTPSSKTSSPATTTPTQSGLSPQLSRSTLKDNETSSTDVTRSASLNLVPQPSISALSGHDTTVTPLHLLSDQSDMVDCPFCRRRSETRVKLTPSRSTHYVAAGLFLTTLGGVVAPYKKNWKSNVSHYCTNCDHKVAFRPYKEEMQALGTPEHMREVSKFSGANESPSQPQS